ncbi:MAG TPA: sugar transferase [Candidatus Binatia bacterium]|jgi:exopolysaccharide biosynthesis polyprenyl glycosylphosphotransferase|nr:sugar transferase [Candidatus Binatia bacterium]
MLRRDRLIRMQIHELMDTTLFAFSFWLAFALRSDLNVIDLFGLEPVEPSFRKYVWLYVILIPAVPMVLEAQGFYNRPMLCSRRTTAWVLFKACFLMTLGLILALFLFRTEIARWIPIWFGVISFVLVFVKEELLLMVFKSQLAKTQHRRRFVLVGTRDETARMKAELKVKSGQSMEVAAEIDLDQTPLQHLVDLLHEHSINGVIISSKRAFFDQVEAAIRACELEGVEVWLVADFFKTQISRTSLDDFYGQPILVFRTTPEASWQSVLKRVIDILGSAIGLLLLSLVLPVFALLVRLGSPGPVFFRQQRSGLNGRPFTIYKFRTMVSNAEQFQHELAAMNEMNGPVFKVTKDPRITPFGKFLRKFSFDELPQLYNVLRGEMSLVGPRPLPVDEVRRFNDLAHRRRLSVKPGLTCLWQISGRNNVKDFRDWVRLDLEYIDNWSLWLDFKILWRTVPVVLAGTGAK